MHMLPSLVAHALPSLVAHAGGYMIMVDAYNTVDVTVECQIQVGGRAAFFRDGSHRYLQILFDALRHVRSFTTFT